MNILIIAGAGCRKGMNQKIKDLIEERSEHKVVLTEPEGITMDKMVEHLEEEVKVFNGEDFVILGHCYGALGAEGLLAKKISNYKGLLICNSYSDFTKITFQTVKDSGEGKEIYMELGYPEVYWAIKNNSYTDHTLSRQLGYAFKEIDGTPYLENADIPIFVLGSDQDTIFPPKLLEDMYSKIKGDKRLCIIEGARHIGILSHPDEYVEQIIDWVDYVEDSNESEVAV